MAETPPQDPAEYDLAPETPPAQAGSPSAPAAAPPVLPYARPVTHLPQDETRESRLSWSARHIYLPAALVGIALPANALYSLLAAGSLLEGARAFGVSMMVCMVLGAIGARLFASATECEFEPLWTVALRVAAVTFTGPLFTGITIALVGPCPAATAAGAFSLPCCWLGLAFLFELELHDSVVAMLIFWCPQSLLGLPAISALT